jgi:hypothetical protein
MGAGSIPKITVPIGPGRRRRRTLPLLLPIALGCGALVVVVRMLTPSFEQRVGVVLSGIITAVMFVAVGLYSVRKRNLWFSLRMLNLARRVLPKFAFERAVFIDRLETWRVAHVVIAMLSLLPFWWHMQRHLMGPVEAALASAVALLFVSGLFGILVQDRMPHFMTLFAEHEVRPVDINAKINAVYVEAEEKILGHPEEFIKAYLARIKPILLNDRSSWQLLFATIAKRDVGGEVHSELARGETFAGNDGKAWNELIALAIRKVNLEQNDFNIWLSNSWLRFHIIIAVLTGALLVFHVLSVLYYGGT